MKNLTKMKVSSEYPPNIEKLVRAFGSDPTAVYCYGDTIYNPSGREITPDVEIHEAVHSRQQGEHPEFWCDKYIEDAEFRLQCEVEAYGAQYAFASRFVPSTHIRKWLVDKLASELSSPCYNLGITWAEARSKIRNFAKHNPY